MASKHDYLGEVYNGEECYSSAMENSRKVLRTFTETIMQYVENLLRPESVSGTMCIAEFGAADGGVSLELMDTVIDYINRMSSDQREIILVYEDQLLNDYNVLFKTVHDTNPDMAAKLSTRDNVHVMASATSMYRKCLPTGFVDLAFSSMATGWLSERPCHIRGGIFQSDCNDEELEGFRRQWHADWNQFLSCRALELRPGGYMVVISFVTGDRNNLAREDLHSVFNSTWKDFWQSGKITEEEFVCTMKLTYHPTKTELVQSFHTDIEGSLSLVDCTESDVEVIPALTNDAGTEDRKTFVDRSLRCTKPWLYNILKSGLSPDRNEADKSRFLDEYFETLRNVLSQKTKFCPLSYNTVCVIAKRTHL